MKGNYLNDINMYTNRLNEIKDNLEILREQQAGLEKEALLMSGLEKIQVKQRLSKEVKPEIKRYEEEYWTILSEQSGSIEIAEKEAQVVVAQMVEQVDVIEGSSTTYPDAVLTLLKDIQNQLNQQNKPAAAKLKGIISSIPPFVGISYEAELDTENFLRTKFPTFINIVETAIKKKFF